MDKRTISLPSEHATYIDKKVNSGDYASASEVVRAGLRALQERDKAVENWLNHEVAKTFDAMQETPSRAISSNDVFTEISKEHAAKYKRGDEGS